MRNRSPLKYLVGAVLAGLSAFCFVTPVRGADVAWAIRDIGATNRPIQLSISGLPEEIGRAHV